MTAGLPATSPEEQSCAEHPRIVTVPVYVPGAIVGAKGVIVRTPLVWPLMLNEAENVEPVTEEIPTKTVPPLIDAPTSRGAGVAPFWVAVKVTLVVDTDSERPPPPLPPPPPPLQAAKSIVKATHSICALQRTRLIMVPPFTSTPDEAGGR
ncbi:MAG TPA: hypothetical protein VK643_01185 [Burkholderiales bacterium]|nr:hypothetical protein [Burkholderiales bacterium]